MDKMSYSLENGKSKPIIISGKFLIFARDLTK